MRRRLQEIQRLQKRVTEQREWITRCGGTLIGYRANYNTEHNVEFYGEDYADNIWHADNDELQQLEAALRLAELQEADCVRPGFTWVPTHTRAGGGVVHGHWRSLA
jgi:hypothetical protein